ncbi:hypothetical protein B7463_g11442, partial [Scytalidium lignicola]
MPSATNGSTVRIQFDTFSNIIDGKLTTTVQTRHGINPATKKSNPPVPNATKQDPDNAIQAARAAFIKWSQSTIEERKTALTELAPAALC